MECHNPYFSRWFSAINITEEYGVYEPVVTILILVDGFLQFQDFSGSEAEIEVTILILVDGFLQLNINEQVVDTVNWSQSLF